MDERWKKEDICTHLGDDYDRFLGAVVPPIFQNSLFVDSKEDKPLNPNEKKYVYTRVSNPTTEIVEKKIAALEGSEGALCFSSGMAAISNACMYFLSQNSHVILIKNSYVPTKIFLEQYMRKFGIEVTYVTGESLEEIEKSIKKNTKLIYLESPSTSIFSLQDLEAIGKLAKAYGINTVIDNSWATPMFQNPIKLGIDVVIHTASKYLGGHSDIIGGVIAARKEIIDSMIEFERGLFGGIMDPHQSWLLLRGIRTLPVRMKQHQESAMKIASFLEAHPKVKKVMYPGLKSHPQYELGRKQMTGYSGVFSFVPVGSPDSINKFMKRLKYFQQGPSWGGFESLISGVGVGMDEETSRDTRIPQGTVRISVGLEDVDTLIEDLDRSLSLL